MADAPKTVPTEVDVPTFLAGIEDPRRRSEAEALAAHLADWTGEPPVLWGSSMIGYGSHHYRYATGREGDTFAVGFAARKQQLVVYLDGFDDPEDAELLARLGPHSTARACLYLKRLADVDADVLRELVQRSQAKRAERERLDRNAD